MPRVGFMSGNLPSLVAAFQDELRRLGYVDGKNIHVESRLARPNTTDTPAHAAELASLGLDFLVVAALPQALAVRRANPALPMVIITCPGMVSNGFAATFERPGGIYTGIDELPPGVTAKRLQLLKEAVPGVVRVALLSTTPGVGGHETQLAEARDASTGLGVTVQPYRATSLPELRTALESIAEDNVDGLLNFQGGLSLEYRALIVEFLDAHRMPAIYQSEFFVAAGGLMSWAPDIHEQYRMGARYAHQIIRGANPGDLPIQYPGRYYLTVNTAAAARIGLWLPPSFTAKADKLLS
jgi:putative ABC transport system substrate-binding protein